MTTARAAIAVALSAAVVVAAVFLLRDRGSSPDAATDRDSDERPAGSSQPLAGASRTPARTPEPSLTSSPDPKAAAAAALDEFERVIASGDVARARAAARDLRRLLRTDRAALEMAAARLTHKSLASNARCALALVLGTLPGEAGELADRALASAIRGAPWLEDSAFQRCVLLALGAQREPAEDDDVFGLGDRPHGAIGSTGLGITVRREIPDRPPEVGYTLLWGLQREEPSLREAAARSMSASMGRKGFRTAFVSGLSSEAEDDVAAALAEPLAEWAGSASAAKSEAERDEVVSTLLGRASQPDFDACRFAIEDAFERMPLSDEQRTDLVSLARSGSPFSIRSFALTAAARGAARGGAVALDFARLVLVDVALPDQDPAVRDLAARLVGTLPYEKRSAGWLASLARNDTAWNVRFTAMESFARVAPRDEALALLRAAKGDTDSRVAARAAELLAAMAR